MQQMLAQTPEPVRVGQRPLQQTPASAQPPPAVAAAQPVSLLLVPYLLVLTNALLLLLVGALVWLWLRRRDRVERMQQSLTPLVRAGYGMRSATAGTSCNVPPRRNRWLSPLIVSLGVAVGPLDTAVNIAFPRHYCRFCHPSDDYTVGRHLLCAHLCQSLTRLWTSGRRHRAQTRLSLRPGMECHQFIPVWLGSHLRHGYYCSAACRASVRPSC